MTWLGMRLVPIPFDKVDDFYINKGSPIKLPCWRCPFPSFFSGAVVMRKL